MMIFQRKLPIPKKVKGEFPLTERMTQVKAARDDQIRRFLRENPISLF